AKHHCQVPSLGLIPRHRFGRCFGRCKSGWIKLRDRMQHLAAMPQQDSEILEVLLRQMAEDREVNSVLGEALGVLSQSERCQPLGDAFHGTSRRWKAIKSLLLGFWQFSPRCNTRRGGDRKSGV